MYNQRVHTQTNTQMALSRVEFTSDSKDPSTVDTKTTTTT